MNKNRFSELSDDELLKASKDFKPNPVLDAFFIGFLVGIIIYGLAVSAWGFTIIVPLFLIYILLKKPKQYKALQNELKERKLQ